MSKEWQTFWGNYRNAEARSEDDLFVQVGKTIASQPIPRDIFSHMVERIVDDLQLGHDDHLLDLCCGNGLITFELAKYAGRITAVDFADHLIRTAKEFKAQPNIEYRVGDVTSSVATMLGQTKGEAPAKYLMNDALAYFEPLSLLTIIENICAARAENSFRFLITGIPNIHMKWNFYDTPERKARHLEDSRAENVTNDGLGRWWDPAEIEAVCVARGLHFRIADQPNAISNYRMDALIWRA